ncbi:unnamed protein product [Meganyctiphanes norvegica]|uniref:Uncharacterized protein n=1 Tax=Meganyctiphanes norvegica TaxID=48144 RepID=A0AAV2S9C4_MEGNR
MQANTCIAKAVSFKKHCPSSSKSTLRFNLEKVSCFQSEDLNKDNMYNEQLEKIQEAAQENAEDKLDQVILNEKGFVWMYDYLLQSSSIYQDDGIERRRMCRHIYLMMCDSVLSTVNNRSPDHYQTNLTLAAIDAVNEPESSNFLKWPIIVPLVTLYNMEMTAEVQEQCKQARALMKHSKKKDRSIHNALQEVKSAKLWVVVELMELAMTFPSTIADLKRSIDTLKLISDVVTDVQKDTTHKEQGYEYYGLQNLNSSLLYLEQLPNGLFLRCNNTKRRKPQINKRYNIFKFHNCNRNVVKGNTEKSNQIPQDIRDWIFDTVLSKYTSVK